jgi:F-type H+-transporting ATPase subunit b
VIDLHILQTPGFWLLLSFILFLILIGRPVLKIILVNLDAQSKSIATELDAAKKARKEAEAFLKAAKEQKESATEQAKAILEHAKKEGARLEADASKNLDELLTREKKRVEENIERLEVESTKRLQAKASELSLQATKEILATLMTDKNAQKAFDQKVLEDLKKVNNS